MAVHTLDNIEKILEDDKENDYAKTDSSVALEIDSINLVGHGPNFDNILQVFQNPQVIGFLRGLMTHQAPQDVQSSQSSHTVTSHEATSPQDENPPNPDRNDSTVLQVDNSSSETEYLENLNQEFERTEKRGPPMSS